MLDWSRFGATSQVGDLVSKIEPQCPHWSEDVAVREFVYDEERMLQNSRPSLHGAEEPPVAACSSPVPGKRTGILGRPSSRSPTGVEKFEAFSSPAGVAEFDKPKSVKVDQQEESAENELRMGSLLAQ
jgi:hypothetical protein